MDFIDHSETSSRGPHTRHPQRVGEIVGDVYGTFGGVTFHGDRDLVAGPLPSSVRIASAG
ncbi:hypothetical protein [Nocardia sp. NPDC046763]|uniref:hypothetical protein n=1 Tax=Nocardia sp. NPDC046763 TaxID=3155256 RepID=UPI00340EC46D